jgi:ribonuclease Z
MHGDHTFGLMGLIASAGLAGNAQSIDVYGPSGLSEYLQACAKYAYMNLSSRLKVHQVSPGIVYEDENFQVSCQLLKHRVPAYGYRIEEKARSGKFDVAKAQALGIPPGPVYGKLKAGLTITLEDGRMINGAELCSAPETGRKIAYCTDTVFCDAAVELAQDADVLIHEATYAHQDAKMAFERLHSTSTMAAQVALLAGVKQLIMTHFSPRYTAFSSLTLDALKQEARAIFPQTKLAYDFYTYEVPRHK